MILFNRDSFETKKKVNLKNLVQRFCEVQQCLNNNRKPYIAIYILNQHKIVYQQNLKLKSILLHDVIDHVIYLCFFVNAKISGLELVSLPHFLHDFWRKIFPLLFSITWPNFIFWLALLSEILGNICIVIVCKASCDIIHFEILKLRMQ